MRPLDTPKIFPFLAPFKGQLYEFRVHSTLVSPVGVCYKKKRLKHVNSVDMLWENDEDNTIFGSDDASDISTVTPGTVATKSRRDISTSSPCMARPRSPDKALSCSSNSPSSNLSRSPRPRDKTRNNSSQSPRKVPQDPKTTVAVTEASPMASTTVRSKRLVQKGLDVSPAMLEFFGMKPVSGPNACFEFIEQREPLPFQKTTIVHQGVLQHDNLFAITDDNHDRDNDSFARITRNRHESTNERNSWGPGPEHFAGVDDLKEGAINNDDFTYNESQVLDNESKPKLSASLYEGQVQGKRQREMLDKSRKEVGKLAKNSLDNLEPSKPGPEYFSGDATLAVEGSESMVDDGVRVFEVTATAAVAARNAVKEGGGFGEPSMGINNAVGATSDRAVMTAAETETSMNSGSGGSLGAILIKGAQIVNDDSIHVADVLIQDNIIWQISNDIEAPQGAEVIDGTGRALMPAGIDVYNKFFSSNIINDFETSSKSALAGGTATIIYVIQAESNESLLTVYDRLCKMAESKSICNFAFSAVISKWNDSIKKEMSLLVHDKGINSFIIDIQKDDQLYEIFDHCRNLRVHARIIPENKSIVSLLEKRLRASGVTSVECFHLSRLHLLEADMVNRISVLSRLTNCPVAVMSLCSTEAADVILQQRNLMLIPEVPVVALTEKSDERSGMMKKLWRFAESPSSIISCLSSMPLCICVSDHCQQKKDSDAKNSAQSGVSFVEKRMSVLWEKGVLSGHIDPMRFVAVSSSNAAKVFNLYPKKGRIAVGADADLVMWELSTKNQIQASNQQSQVLPQVLVHSKPVMTICGGRIAFNRGKFDSGRGKLVELVASSPYLYSVIEQLEKLQISNFVEGDVEPTSDLSHQWENLAGSGNAVPAKNHRKHFESSYSETPHDKRGMRASTKVLNPPGGRSTGFW